LFGWDITLNWTPLLPAMNGHIAREGIASMFGLFFTVMVFKGILVSMAGAAPNYDMQRILAAKNPREASLMSAIVSVCLVPRWILIGGITLLGLVFVTPEFRKMGDNIDFETVLPFVINRFLPVGLVGVLLAGLLSSFMANFSATVNAGAAYLVNDIYKKYLNPEADNRRLVKFSYLGSVLILGAGIVIGMYLSSITQITQWIVGGLYGGYTAANILKWYWWRFNGYGYFWGMLVGIVAALVVPASLPVIAPRFHDPTYAYPFILLFSFVGCIAGTLLTKPVQEDVLKNFYRSVRPWGFWKPVYALVAAEDPSFEENKNATRDLVNCLVGIPWQLMLVTIPLYVIFRDVRGVVVSLIVLISTTIFLKKFWYDRLEKSDDRSVIGDAELSPAAEIAGD
jgi:Na+/proline symporter